MEIDLNALRHNLKEIRRLVGPDIDIMAVVKAEAYGHGAVEIAKTALASGANWLGVALPEEGIVLRRAGFTAPILVFGALQANQVESFVNNKLIPAVCSEQAAAALSQAALAAGVIAPVHIKVDTGMGRIGVQPREAMAFISKVSRLSGIKVSGIFSHLATADEKNKEYALKQINTFTGVLTELKKAGLLPEKIHLANSAGIIDLPASYFNMVRPGIILYGLYPSAEVNRERIQLKPVLSLKTRITFLKRVPKGAGISYGQKYHLEREATIATIPIGYADGWSRLLSGKAEAIVGGKKFPIVGTICMDQCMINLGDEPAELGQEVVLIGRMGEVEIPADTVAGQMGTINYEVTCMLNGRVPRVYLHEE
ncbi:MAG: alanine racemase [Bacillota bacterium]